MIKLGGLPSRGVMTHLACLSEALLHVVGIVSSLKILEVTRNTSSVGARQIVVIVSVTTRARRIGVCSGQRKT